MNLRHARFLAAAAVLLLPATARADRHSMECLTGYTPEEKGIFLLRAGCGFHFDQGVLVKINDFFFSRGSSIALTAQDPVPPAAPTLHKDKHFYFYFEFDEMGNDDSGLFDDGFLGGGRYFFRARKTLQPFLGGLVGKMRPLPEQTGDPAQDRAWTAIATTGVDLNTRAHLWNFDVVLRAEADRVGTDGVYPHNRFTGSVILRFEK